MIFKAYSCKLSKKIVKVGLKDSTFLLIWNTYIHLKVPKRENFSLAFFAQSEPSWVCDLGSGEKNRIFYQMTPVFDGFWFFVEYWVCGKPNKIWS